MNDNEVMAKHNQGDVLLNQDISMSAKIDVATDVANTLKTMIDSQGLISVIQGKQYVVVEGWQTLGTTLGLHTEVSIEPFDLGIKTFKKTIKTGSFKEPTKEVSIDVVCFKADVKVLNMNGDVIGNGSAICSNTEKGKEDNAPFAIYSMAQTRATGKAYRNCLGWIMKLAGYQTTPAEEMDFKQEVKAKQNQPEKSNQTSAKNTKSEKETVKEPENIQEAEYTKKDTKELNETEVDMVASEELERILNTIETKKLKASRKNIEGQCNISIRDPENTFDESMKVRVMKLADTLIS